MEHFNVSVVCHGQTPIIPCEDGSDPYAEPKKQNKFKLLDSGNDMTTEKIVERIILHRYVPSLQDVLCMHIFFIRLSKNNDLILQSRFLYNIVYTFIHNYKYTFFSYEIFA